MSANSHRIPTLLYGRSKMMSSSSDMIRPTSGSSKINNYSTTPYSSDIDFSFVARKSPPMEPEQQDSSAFSQSMSYYVPSSHQAASGETRLRSGTDHDLSVVHSNHRDISPQKRNEAAARRRNLSDQTNPGHLLELPIKNGPILQSPSQLKLVAGSHHFGQTTKTKPYIKEHLTPSKQRFSSNTDPPAQRSDAPNPVFYKGPTPIPPKNNHFFSTGLPPVKQGSAPEKAGFCPPLILQSTPPLYFPVKFHKDAAPSKASSSLGQHKQLDRFESTSSKSLSQIDACLRSNTAQSTSLWHSEDTSHDERPARHALPALSSSSKRSSFHREHMTSFKVVMSCLLGDLFLAAESSPHPASPMSTLNPPPRRKACLSTFHVSDAVHLQSGSSGRLPQLDKAAAALYILPIVSIIREGCKMSESVSNRVKSSLTTPTFICLAPRVTLATPQSPHWCVLRGKDQAHMYFENVNLDAFIAIARKALDTAILSDPAVQSSSSEDEAVTTSTGRALQKALKCTLRHLYTSDLSDAVWFLELDNPGTRRDDCKAHNYVELRHMKYRIQNVEGKYLGVSPKESSRSTPHETKADMFELVLQEQSNSTGGQVWYFSNSSRPFQPLWIDNFRKLLCSANILCEQTRGQHPSAQFSYEVPEWTYSSPTYVQEKLLLDDIFFCFAGVSGQFIRILLADDELRLLKKCCVCKGCSSPMETALVPLNINQRIILTSTAADPISWYYSLQMGCEYKSVFDPALLEMALKIIGLSRIQRKVVQFIETHSDCVFGSCSQALSEALQELLRDFTTALSQAEAQHRAGKLSLQKLWFYLQPSTATFEVLEKVVEATLYKQGGNLLNGLYSLVESLSITNPSRSIYMFLLRRTSVPFLRMLEHWIYTGAIHDPYQDFFIVENLTITPASSCAFVEVSSKADQWQEDASLCLSMEHPYWLQKFVVKESYIPIFLESIAETVFQAGKHLNILLSCDPYHKLSKDRLPAFYSETILLEDTEHLFEAQHLEPINQCVYASTQHLIQYLMTQCDLMGRLTSIRHFMFFSRSDMALNFFDALQEEMEVYSMEAIKSRLAALLDKAMTWSSLSSDAHKGEFHFTLSQFSLRAISEWLVPSNDIDETTQKKLSSNHRAKAVSSDMCPGYVFANIDEEGLNAALGIHPTAESGTPKDEEFANGSGHLNKTFSTRLFGRGSNLIPHMEKFQELGKFLTLMFEFAWPLNLIFTKAITLKYQLISRLIIQLKLLEKKLKEVWQVQMKGRSLRGRSQTAEKNSLLSSHVRLRTHHFIRNLIFYITNEVLEPKFYAFYQRVHKASHLDEIILWHHQYLDACLEESLLTQEDALRNLSKVITVCHLYCNTALKFGLYCFETSTVNKASLLEKSDADGRTPLKASVEHSKTLMSEEKFGEIMQQYSEHFDRNLKNFITTLIAKSRTYPSYSKHIFNLLTRLDYNGFYTKAFDLENLKFESPETFEFETRQESCR